MKNPVKDSPSTGSGRVYRGGSWGSYARNARVSIRGSDGPSYRHDFLGFRLARTIKK